MTLISPSWLPGPDPRILSLMVVSGTYSKHAAFSSQAWWATSKSKIMISGRQGKSSSLCPAKSANHYVMQRCAIIYIYITTKMLNHNVVNSCFWLLSHRQYYNFRCMMLLIQEGLLHQDTGFRAWVSSMLFSVPNLKRLWIQSVLKK